MLKKQATISTHQNASPLPPAAEREIRQCVQRELADTTEYELPLLDAYIALAASTLVTSSQLRARGINATPKDTYPVAVDEVHQQRAQKLSVYFQAEPPETRFYMLCLAKGYLDVIPRDPPWIDEAKVLALASGVADPKQAGLVKTVQGRLKLVPNQDIDTQWAKAQPDLPKTDFTPNRLEGTPVFQATPEKPRSQQMTLL